MGSLDQKLLKRKRKTKQKQRITKKKPNIDLFEIYLFCTRLLCSFQVFLSTFSNNCGKSLRTYIGSETRPI